MREQSLGPDGPQPWEPFWEQAVSITDHGAEMTAWLRGERSGHPGYGGLPALETARLTTYLTRLNAAGLVTVGSQPSLAEAGWEQRAFLDAYGQPSLVGVVAGRLRRHGFVVDTWPTVPDAGGQAGGRRTVVSRTRTEDVTFVGRWTIDDVMAGLWRTAAARHIRMQLSSTQSMTAYDPRWPSTGPAHSPDRIFQAACAALEHPPSDAG